MVALKLRRWLAKVICPEAIRTLDQLDDLLIKRSLEVDGLKAQLATSRSFARNLEEQFNKSGSESWQHARYNAMKQTLSSELKEWRESGKRYRMNKDGKLIHDGDCGIYRQRPACTCGLLHMVLPRHDKTQCPNFWEDYGKQCETLDGDQETN
jgi:hypothetical protein